MGLLGRGGPTKTLFLHQARAQSVSTRLALTRTRREVFALHSRPATLPPIITGSLVDCMGILLDSHPRYLANPVTREAAMLEVVRLMSRWPG